MKQPVKKKQRHKQVEKLTTPLLENESSRILYEDSLWQMIEGSVLLKCENVKEGRTTKNKTNILFTGKGY